MDFTNYKFRCSAIGYLMTEARDKNQALGETVKKYLQKIYIKEVFGREYDLESKFCDKGLLVEEDSIKLAEMHLNKKLLVKNKEQLQNEYLTGTPDLILADQVVDLKSSWNLETYASADGTNKMYYWQLQGYMALTGKTQAQLLYCLCDTPEHLIASEFNRQVYRTGYSPDSEEYVALEEEVRHNLTFGDIEPKLKVKSYSFGYDEEAVEKLYDRIEVCREYLTNYKW